MLIHATTWVNLENIMLSDRKTSPKTTSYIILLVSRIGKSMETESTSWLPGLVGREQWA